MATGNLILYEKNREQLIGTEGALLDSLTEVGNECFNTLIKHTSAKFEDEPGNYSCGTLWE